MNLRVPYRPPKVRSPWHQYEDSQGQHEHGDRERVWNRFAVPDENNDDQRCGSDDKNSHKCDLCGFLVLLHGGFCQRPADTLRALLLVEPLGR